MDALSIRAATAEILEELMSVVVVFREGEDGSGHGIEFQRSLVVYEQDRPLGMDTYCVTTSEGASIYGGVSSCVLDDGMLTVKLTTEAQHQLGVDDGLRLTLLVSEETLDQVRGGLARVFEGNQPNELRLT